MKPRYFYFLLFGTLAAACLVLPVSCLSPERPTLASGKPPKKPLIEGIYTADPSAHVFEGKVYLYPSHDRDKRGPAGGDGSEYAMEDYHVFSMTSMAGPVVDHGMVLHVDDVPWAKKQMWAPDAAFRNGTYYFYFPARDQDGIFRIGVATGTKPSGPFTPQPEPIPGSYSIDPALFIDEDGQAYMYFGGLWGGQLEKWTSGSYNPAGEEPGMGDALGPRVARMSEDMLGFDGKVEEIEILDENGSPMSASAGTRRFFEGAWMHKHEGQYYLSYSTGNSHLIVYATGGRPPGPFQYRGVVLNPVIGWTTQHAIVEFQGQWYLFYHDASLSGGINYQRCVKVAKLQHNPDGTIQTVEPE